MLKKENTWMVDFMFFWVIWITVGVCILSYILFYLFSFVNVSLSNLF